MGVLPYAKVFNTVATIQQQAQAQIKSADDDSQTETNPASRQAVSERQSIPQAKSVAFAG